MSFGKKQSQVHPAKKDKRVQALLTWYAWLLPLGIMLWYSLIFLNRCSFGQC